MKRGILLKPLRVGVIGVGYLGQHHTRLYQEIPDCQLVGIADINKERVTQLGNKFAVPAFTDLEELLPKVEAVSVVVPTENHYSVAKRVLETGCHLLLEKPITKTISEAEELISLAKSKDLIFQIGHVERYNPAVRAVENFIHQPFFIEARRLGLFSPRGANVSVTLELMIHDLEIILHFVKSPVIKIEAMGANVLSPNEDIANVYLEFGNGSLANLTASRISPEKMRQIQFFQEKTCIFVDYLNQIAKIQHLSSNIITSEEIEIKKDEPLRLELISFINCVKNRTKPLVSGEKGLQALKLVHEIQQKIEQRKEKWKSLVKQE
ncbi:MAG: Gfo/Idh/MocA family oxidoreductase [Candidatus Edwardsbacteria bacterium]